MTDIVERLHEIGRFLPFAEEAETVMKAADEVERLEHEVAQMTTARTVMEAEIKRLREEIEGLKPLP